MKIDTEKLSDTQQKVVVTVPSDKVTDEMKTTLAELKQNIHVNGFRPGKVPESIIKMRFGKDIRHQIGLKLIEESFSEVLEKSELNAVGEPIIHEWELAEDQDFQFSVTLHVVPAFEVKDYKGLEVEKVRQDVTDDEVNSRLDRIRDSSSTFEVVDGRPTQDSDQLFGRITLSIDGAAVPGWNNRTFDTIIGSGRLFPDSEFESNLVGLTVDDSKEFDLTFSDEYSYYKDFAGKTVHVAVSVTEIKEKQVPDLDDDLAKDIGLETLDELKQKIRDDIVAMKEKQAGDSLRESALDKLLESNNVVVPDILIEEELKSILSQFQFAMPDDEAGNKIRDQFRDLAARNVKKRFLLDQVAKQEKIEISEEDVEDEFEMAVQESHMDRNELRERWEEHGIFDGVKRKLTHEKTMELILGEAVIKEVDPPIAEDNANDENTKESVSEGKKE